MASIGSADDPDGNQVRFQLSARHAHELLSLGVPSALTAMVFVCAAVFSSLISANAVWLGFFCVNAAALFLFLAAVHSSYEIAVWRRKQTGLLPLPPSATARIVFSVLASPWSRHDEPAEGDVAKPDWIERLIERIVVSVRSLASCVGSGPLVVAGLSVCAGLIVWQGWPLAANGETIARSAAYLCITLSLVPAFLLLVVERRLSATGTAEWPEAPTVSQLARLPIFAILTSSFGLFLATTQAVLALKILSLAAALVIVVAAELLLRAIAAAFAPRHADREPSPIAASLVMSGIFQWPPRPLLRLQDELRSRHGIDLRSIWAVSFIKKALPPMVLASICLGWILTGIREVPMGSRGIYERFGKMQTVLPPGLHVGLPLPFGKIIPVENGSVHELATAATTDADNEPLAEAEGPAPENANRLWDRTHTSEKSQVIAGGKDGFQIVNMDVRFIYRIGLTDEAAVKAAYRAADLPSLIKSLANRILVHDFGKRTLDDVLSEGRLLLAQDIASALQKNLDDLDSGVEILAVVVEAIHPPAGASEAFHGVQAAQITAEALVAEERGNAAVQKNEAQETASLQIDAASAAAREETAASEAARVRFDAERSAYQAAGRTFLTEEYFRQLAAGLSTSRSLLLDHRLGASIAPTLDLRNMMQPVDPDPAGGPEPTYRDEETSQ